MTANQINYRANLEKERTNRAMELETNRHNVAIEEIQRSNVDVSSRMADETARHNKAMEGLQGYSAQLQERMNAVMARHYELQDRISATKTLLDDARGRMSLLQTKELEERRMDVDMQKANLSAETSRYVAGVNAATSALSTMGHLGSTLISSYTNLQATENTNRNRTINTVVSGLFNRGNTRSTNQTRIVTTMLDGLSKVLK